MNTPNTTVSSKHIEFGFTAETVNTQYAPLAALLAHFRGQEMLRPLEEVPLTMKSRTFRGQDKLLQVLVSILAGCQTLSEVNSKLSSEPHLATVWQWPHFAEQSTLSRTLNALTLMNIVQLRAANTAILSRYGRTSQHDWRGYLWLDFDLSGLPCGKQAEGSQKGYFSGKKTPADGN